MYRTGNGAAESNAPGHFDFFNQSNGREMHRMINTHIEASKIGRQIAEQVLDHQRRVGDSSSESSPDPETTETNPHQHIAMSESSISNSEMALDRRTAPPNEQRLNGTLPGYSQVRNNIVHPNHSSTEVLQMMTTGDAPNQAGTTDGNDEAAMAVIMSLLEADAGLGGPVDFTGLPWPLP